MTIKYLWLYAVQHECDLEIAATKSRGGTLFTAQVTYDKDPYPAETHEGGTLTSGSGVAAEWAMALPAITWAASTT